jgi:hypothetical protein
MTRLDPEDTAILNLIGVDEEGERLADRMAADAARRAKSAKLVNQSSTLSLSYIRAYEGCQEVSMMLDTLPWDVPCATWGDLLESGIDERQLRGAIDRDLLKIGEKRRNRLMFTPREMFGVDLAAALTSLWVPISIASTVATAIIGDTEQVLAHWDEIYSVSAQQDELRLVVFNPADGNLAMLCQGSAGKWEKEGRLKLNPSILSNFISVSLSELIVRSMLFALQSSRGGAFDREQLTADLEQRIKANLVRGFVENRVTLTR